MPHPRDIKAQRRLLKNARREMALVLIVIALALMWTVGYCYLNGYQHAPDSWVVEAGWATPRTAEDFRQIGGLPDWVLVGIILPWMMCSALGIGLGLGLKDDDLGEEHTAAGAEEEGGGGMGQERNLNAGFARNPNDAQSH